MYILVPLKCCFLETNLFSNYDLHTASLSGFGIAITIALFLFKIYRFVWQGVEHINQEQLSPDAGGSVCDTIWTRRHSELEFNYLIRNLLPSNVFQLGYDSIGCIRSMSCRTRLAKLEFQIGLWAECCSKQPARNSVFSSGPPSIWSPGSVSAWSVAGLCFPVSVNGISHTLSSSAMSFVWAPPDSQQSLRNDCMSRCDLPLALLCIGYPAGSRVRY